MTTFRLAPAFATALRTAELGGLTEVDPADRRDRFDVLQAIYDLHTAPADCVGDTARFQHHPVVSALKGRLETAWLSELPDVPAEWSAEPDVVVALRSMAVYERLPRAYRWLAQDAQWSQVVQFLALEGGPDAGFDDLVAACQLGLTGSAKMALARNYWDEMGNGTPEAVHTTLYDRLVEAVQMPRLPREQLPVEALERAALGGLLATNRWLQPEMLGALGMVELQAGPRCRLVVRAFERLGAPEAAYPFYREHAEVDPRHGKDWLEKAIAPQVGTHPEWGPRVLRGAWWRSQLSLQLFAAVERSLVEPRDVAA